MSEGSGLNIRKLIIGITAILCLLLDVLVMILVIVNITKYDLNGIFSLFWFLVLGLGVACEIIILSILCCHKCIVGRLFIPLISVALGIKSIVFIYELVILGSIAGDSRYFILWWMVGVQIGDFAMFLLLSLLSLTWLKDLMRRAEGEGKGEGEYLGAPPDQWSSEIYQPPMQPSYPAQIV